MVAIGVIIGSTRPGRVGRQVGEWAAGRAIVLAAGTGTGAGDGTGTGAGTGTAAGTGTGTGTGSDDTVDRTGDLEVTVDLIDLAEVALPFLDEAEHASTRVYTHQHTRDWSARIEALDAVVLVTPEYNGSFPAPLKNALDFLSEEWKRKPVAMIGYGGTSAGTRAVQALLPVVVSLGMVPAGAVYLPLRARLDDGILIPTHRDDEGLDEVLAGLVELAGLFRPAAVYA